LVVTASPYILAIDQGTTSTRAILFDAAGRARSTAQIELTQHYPQPGWVEHDPEEIWRSVVATCREAAAAADGPIAAIGIANQRETTVLWDRATGAAVHNAIVWQDRRTAELCERWRREGLGEAVAQRTGLVVDPYFSASKIAWLLGNVPGLRERAEAGEIAFGTIDSYLLWRFSGGRRHMTDVTNASRTMLFDIRRLGWDDDLLAAFGIPRAVARGAGYRGGFRCRHPGAAGSRDTDRRGRRRPARGADRPGLLSSGDGQIDLRHRSICAAQYRA
jgi:glycerol kinase